MGVLCFYVYVLEEVIPHEGVVALRVISGKPYVGFYDTLLSIITAFNNSTMCNHVKLRERTWQLTYIFIHVERFYVMERDFSSLMILNQFLVTAQGGAS